jgi:hypothetical protein
VLWKLTNCILYPRAVAFILISERPSLLQEVLRSNYDKDPFTKPVSAMIGNQSFLTAFLLVAIKAADLLVGRLVIGASGRNQFTMVRAADTVYSLLQVFSLGRPSACVLDHEDMISWVVRSVPPCTPPPPRRALTFVCVFVDSQSSLVAFVEEYLNSSGVTLGRAMVSDLNVIVSKCAPLSPSVVQIKKCV